MAFHSLKPQADLRGYRSTKENLETVLRNLEEGRVDLAHAVVCSMIGRKMAEETLLDGRIVG